MTAAVLAALFLLPPAAAGTFDAARFGARPGADGAANTRALQAAIDAAGAAGGGTVAVLAPGVYDLAAQGPSPYKLGHAYCLDLRHDGLTLRVGRGVTLRLADGQQTDKTWPVDVVVWRSRKDLRITGGGTISGNTAGQRPWTRGYGEVTNGTLLAGYAGEEAGNERIRIDDITLADHYSNAIALTGHPDSRDRDVEIVGVRVLDTGEGPLVMNADNVTLRDVTVLNRKVSPHPGDGIELWNVSRFAIARATVRGLLGGSAIDVHGSRNGTIDGFVIEGSRQGISVAENASLHGYSERVRVQNGTVTLVQAGTGVFTKGARVRDVTFSAVKVVGPSQSGSIGFQISSDNIPSQPGDDWRQEGPITLERCEAHGLDFGLLIKTVASLSVLGGDYSDNEATPHSDGILWMGQGNARTANDTHGLLLRGVKATGNRRFGLHLDSEGKAGREPAGFLVDCSLGGNGVEGYHVSKEIGHEFVKDLWVDGSCLSFAGVSRP